MTQTSSKHMKKAIGSVTHFAVAISRSAGPAALIAFTVDSNNPRDGMVVSAPRTYGLGYSVKIDMLPQSLFLPTEKNDSVEPVTLFVYQDEKPVQVVGKTINIEPISVRYESSNFILDDVDRLFFVYAHEQKELFSKGDLTVAFDSLGGTEEIEIHGQKISEIATYEGAKQTAAVLRKSFEEAQRHLDFFIKSFEKANFADDKQAVRFFWDYESNSLVLETEGKVNGVDIEELTDLIYTEIMESVTKALDRHNLELERERVSDRLKKVISELDDLKD